MARRQEGNPREGGWAKHLGTAADLHRHLQNLNVSNPSLSSTFKDDKADSMHCSSSRFCTQVSFGIAFRVGHAMHFTFQIYIDSTKRAGIRSYIQRSVRDP